MNMPSKPTIAIFGGTANTGLSVLTYLLEASFPVRALARSPAKLDTLAKKYPSLLHVISGDAQTTEAVKEVIFDSSQKKVVDIVISAIGSVPGDNRASLRNILGVNEKLCQEAISLLLDSLREVTGSATKIPLVVALSTTGVSDKGRDIPLAMVPFYHGVLQASHRDKKAMEGILESGWDNWVIVRPSFLLNPEEKGLDSVRVGVESDMVDPCGNGYFIGRKDVARWIVERVIVPERLDDLYHNKKIGLTY